VNVLKRFWWAAGVLLALAAVLLSPLASPHPDGLEKVAEDSGFSETADEAPYQLLPDYTVPGVGNPALSTIASGVIGAAAVFVLAYGFSRTIRRRSGGNADHPGGAGQ
jgi:cobalt/nickel transport system permease protein